MILNMDTRRIDLIAAGIIIFILVFVYFGFIKDSRARAAELKEKEAMLFVNLNAAGDMNLELERIAGEIDYIQKNLEAFERQLPEEKRMYDFLKEIDSMANENKLELKAISPGKLERKKLYSRVPVTISAISGFKTFYRFLFQLENIPRITRMESLQVKKLPGGNSCKIEMNLALFTGGV